MGGGKNIFGLGGGRGGMGISYVEVYVAGGIFLAWICALAVFVL